jgi:sortase A
LPVTGGVLTRSLRVVGWLCVSAGSLVALYLIYSLLFTNLLTQRSQDNLSERWELEVGSTDGLAGEDPAGPGGATPPPVEPGEAVAVLQFARPGSQEPIVSDSPLFVVEGVGVEDLKRGPGRYPTTDPPGIPGNFAVAGHRTTYLAPFYNLDELVNGDEVWVTDRSGKRFTYQVVEQRIVVPGEDTILGPDPRGTGRPTVTLTTCNPRFSNAQRLVVFAELAA